MSRSRWDRVLSVAREIEDGLRVILLAWSAIASTMALAAVLARHGSVQSGGAVSLVLNGIFALTVIWLACGFIASFFDGDDSAEVEEVSG